MFFVVTHLAVLVLTQTPRHRREVLSLAPVPIQFEAKDIDVLPNADWNALDARIGMMLSTQTVPWAALGAAGARPLRLGPPLPARRRLHVLDGIRGVSGVASCVMELP